MSYKRPGQDEYFMEIANVVAKRSTCLRIHVGAVIVKNGRILSTGYNGAPYGFEHCLDIGCIREKENVAHGTRHELCRAVHAEQNAIIQAALHGVSIEGATIYCTHQPCILCAKMLINGKIKRVVFQNGYPDEMSLQFLKQAGIEILQTPGGDEPPEDKPPSV
ncbi:Deoxycytidylate deaminase [Methanocella conradii HZ254]|uniref:Deoxycytidylate deaminase n=1 Tax=Methanocella conradii (strain DSM 24694 / JCM 17849 / CGMCC 1.5162 / HZ254) TaxID=1041930 RepID=H8I5P2_METCZ|nr:cytidine/deoxycytidylate deaminase family protein [Methanocella conradii]AFC99361.1 Deoxycytidylate deaminase [Methanocella conradii HZ254]MDI6896860.1 cytidine/deoxycytidylate deaminase family protein [Methanocella conradii]